MTAKKRAGLIRDKLTELYPSVKCALNFTKPHELLIATRLSAQCTDKRVNEVTPALFARFPDIDSFAAASIDEVAEYIRSCGLFKTKAADIVNMCVMLKNEYGGVIPDTVEELVKLPGVGRKTANLIVGELYGKPAIVCDTHVIRLSTRLGLTDGTKDAVKAEKQLSLILEPADSMDFCHRLVWHGRLCCTSRKPDCDACVLSGLCLFSKQSEKDK